MLGLFAVALTASCAMCLAIGARFGAARVYECMSLRLERLREDRDRVAEKNLAEDGCAANAGETQRWQRILEFERLLKNYRDEFGFNCQSNKEESE